MNVKQLIETLEKLDPNTMVIRSGYEGGVEEVTHVEVTTIKLNVNTEWWYGSHEETKEGDTQAVYIS
jgi:hypothetical protein